MVFFNDYRNGFRAHMREDGSIISLKGENSEIILKTLVNLIDKQNFDELTNRLISNDSSSGVFMHPVFKSIKFIVEERSRIMPYVNKDGFYWYLAYNIIKPNAGDGYEVIMESLAHEIDKAVQWNG